MANASTRKNVDTRKVARAIELRRQIDRHLEFWNGIAMPMLQRSRRQQMYARWRQLRPDIRRAARVAIKLLGV